MNDANLIPIAEAAAIVRWPGNVRSFRRYIQDRELETGARILVRIQRDYISMGALRHHVGELDSARSEVETVVRQVEDRIVERVEYIVEEKLDSLEGRVSMLEARTRNTHVR